MKTTRKISLTRLHAINWYGYADSIPVAGNLLLAGVTGSGKSILMDLLQFVLVGDRRLVKFNQSATGAASARDLKGYCLGDIKEDEGGVTQYMRDSAITYAALEFTWPGKPERIETWGLRVEYASAAEQQGRISPWWCEGRLDRGDFLVTDPEGKRRPREAADWRAFVHSRGGEVFAGIEEYRRDMSSPGHLNFDHGILSRLLPTAMSFTFLRSFNEFCRLFILPADKLNVSDVTASYRTFQRYEEELGELRRQLEALQEIRAKHLAHAGYVRDAALTRHLAADLGWHHAEAMRADLEKRCEELKKAAAVEEARLAELDEAIPRRREAIEQLKNLIGESPEGRLYQHIRGENQLLAAQIAQLQEIGTTLESAFAARLRAARAWAAGVAKLPLDLDAAAVEAVERATTRAESGGLPQAETSLRTLSDAAQKAAAEVSRAARPTQDRLTRIRSELGVLREEAAALKLGRLPFPTRVLDALNNGLLASGSEPAAQHLCQLCEVRDERWRAAIEVAFTRKFAIVVDAAQYDAAERIYHELKTAGPGQESLVNPTRALKFAAKPKPGSLAEKIETRHPVAAALVNSLFGNLICCEQLADLRNHDFAILPDGFQTRGAFIERVRHYDNLPFVGSRGLQQQLAWKEAQIQERASEEKRLAPIENLVADIQREWRTQFENPAPLYQQLARISELPEKESALASNLEKLKLIDRDQFDEWETQRTALDRELKIWEREQRDLLTNQKRKDIQHAEAALKETVDAAAKAREDFDRIKGATDISPWLPRLEELRATMLAEFPLPDVAAHKFRGQHTQNVHDADVTQSDLTGLRRLFAQRFPKFDDLPVGTADNLAHDRVLAKIEDADIPGYETKSRQERQKWEHLFREQVLEKLRAALVEVKNIIALLNAALNKPIGSRRYFIEHRKNPDFEIYHRMLDATAAAGSDLFASIADETLRTEIGGFLEMLVSAPDGIEAAKLLDYRHSFAYDMTVEDISQPADQRRKISVDRQSGKFSGGENQSPYFIAILASYLRAYRRHDRYRDAPTLSLVPIDEAFSKLSGERIADCIEALAQLELQGMFSMSTGNIPYAFEKCDHLLVVSKEERRVGRRLKVRNVAVSIARDSEEGRQFLGEMA